MSLWRNAVLITSNNTAYRSQFSDVASPWQNGYCESFFGRFKQEFGDPNRFDTAGEFIEAIYRHIHYYNHHRIQDCSKDAARSLCHAQLLRHLSS